MTTIIVENIYRESDYSEDTNRWINDMIEEEIYVIFNEFGKYNYIDYEINSSNYILLEYETIEQCNVAILAMNGKKYRGQELTVSFYNLQ